MDSQTVNVTSPLPDRIARRRRLERPEIGVYDAPDPMPFAPVVERLLGVCPRPALCFLNVSGEVRVMTDL